MSELKKELIRKSIHFIGIVYIPAYLCFGKDVLVLGIISALTFSAVFEFFRLKYGILSFMVREYEEKKIGAYIYFGIAMLVVTVIFPAEACFAAILVSIAGDGAGGIVKRAGFRHSNKLATLVMVLLPFSLSPLLPSLNPVPFLLSCIAGAIVERIERIGRYHIQDNLSVPLVSAVIYWLVNYILP